MKVTYYIADAFTDTVFGGGPAGVVLTKEYEGETAENGSERGPCMWKYAL